MDLQTFLKSGNYLPRPLRDFHNAKRLFKRIDENIQRTLANDDNARISYQGYNWILAHIYVVDQFLWFMARHGWTLQRSRQPLVFADLETTLKEFDERQLQALKTLIDARLPQQHELSMEKSNEPA